MNKQFKAKDCSLRDTGSKFQFGEIEPTADGEGYSIPVKMTIRTNTPVQRWGYDVYHEHSGMVYKDKVNIDFIHGESSIPDSLSSGFLDKFDISNQEINASGKLVSIQSGDLVDITVKKMQAGIPMESSIFFGGNGIKAEEFGAGTEFKVNGENHEGPAIVFREWPLRGVAICPYGADNLTSASLALSEETVSIEFTNKENAMGDKTPEQIQKDNEMKIADLEAKLAANDDGNQNDPTGQDFLDAFSDKGGTWFAEGKTFEEAQLLYIAELKSENEKLSGRLAAVHRGGEDDDAPGSQDADLQLAQKAKVDVRESFDKLSLKISPRLALFAGGIVLPGEKPKPKSTREHLTGIYREIISEVADAKRGMSKKFASPTLIDIAIHNAADGAVGLIDETIEAHPELDVLPARTIAGINYKTLVRTTLPTVAFRNAAEGTAATKGTYVNRLVETFIISPNWQVDKAVADRHEDGAEALIAVEAGAIMEAVMQHLCSVFYYGRIDTNVHATAGDAKGFHGLHSQLGFVVAENILVDAEGSTATTGSSVWMVKGGAQGVQWVWGNDGSLSMSPVREERVTDSGGTNQYTAYFQEMLAYPGLQIGSTQCIGRIGEATEDSADGVTDQRLADLWSQFPVAKKPDHIFMSRRSQRQLRDSRIWATNGTVIEKGQPVPFDYSWEGVPIHITDAIENTEVIGKLS